MGFARPLETLRAAEVNKPHFEIRFPFHCRARGWTMELLLCPVLRDREDVSRHLVD